MINKNELFILTTALKNVEAKNFKLNVQKRQKKIGTIEDSKKTFWGKWKIVHEGMSLANNDTNGMYKNIETHLKSLYNKMTKSEFEWHHIAYMKNRLLPADEPNASVRFTKNATLRVELANKIIDGTISNDYELCNKIRKILSRRGFDESVVYRF